MVIFSPPFGYVTIISVLCTVNVTGTEMGELVASGEVMVMVSL